MRLNEDHLKALDRLTAKGFSLQYDESTDSNGVLDLYAFRNGRWSRMRMNCYGIIVPIPSKLSSI